MKGASVSVAASIRAPRDWFFYWFLSVDLPRIMHRYLILPSVTGTCCQTGPMYRPGSKRLVRFSDGSSAVEEVTSCDPPKTIIYRITELTGFFRYLIKEGHAQIVFIADANERTAVEWQYTFYGHNRFATLLLRPIVSILWRGFMRSALRQSRRFAEREAAMRPKG